MFSKRSVFSTIGLVFLVGATSWLSVRTSTPSRHNNRMHIATSIAHNITITKMTPAGTLKYKTHAQEATQYNNNKTFLTNIKGILVNKKNSAPWHYQSKHGIISQQGSIATLSDNVIAYRNKSPSDPPIKFTTSSITLYPHKNYFETNKPVRIEQPATKNITTAVGMKGYLNNKKIELLKNVKSSYESATSQKT